MLYAKKTLKKEISIVKEKIIILISEFKMVERLLFGKKPPEEIIVSAKLKESKVLKSIIFKIIKIVKVNIEYKIKTLRDCLKVSAVLKDKKLVRDLFKLSSKISIKSIIENKKYNPPIHWEEDLHKIKLGSKCLMFSNTVKPVEVNPEIDSK